MEKYHKIPMTKAFYDPKKYIKGKLCMKVSQNGKKCHFLKFSENFLEKILNNHP